MSENLNQYELIVYFLNFCPTKILLRISSTAFEQLLFLGLDSHKFSLDTFARWKSGRGGKS